MKKLSEFDLFIPNSVTKLMLNFDLVLNSGELLYSLNPVRDGSESGINIKSGKLRRKSMDHFYILKCIECCFKLFKKIIKLEPNGFTIMYVLFFCYELENSKNLTI